MSALTSFYRSLARHPLFVALNIGGLGLGIATFLVLSLFVQFETSFDVFPGSDKLWVVQARSTGPGHSGADNLHVMGGELDLLRAEFPQLVGARWSAVGGTVKRGGQANTENLVLIDPQFLPLFDYKTLAGDPGGTLSQPDGVVISSKIAQRYFGSRSPIGQSLTLTIGQRTDAFRVGAVVADAPRFHDFTGSVFVRMTRERVGSAEYDHWDTAVGWTFLQFPDAADARRFEAQLPAFLERHAFPTGEVRRASYTQSLRPLATVRQYLQHDGAIVVTLGLVGVFTLMIAVVNYVNLATSYASLRAREVALRKVMGGTRRSLILQFMGEAMATVAFAGLVGLALAELALPFINTLGGTDLHIRYEWPDGVLPLVLSLVLVVGLVAGFYPALVLSRYQPATVLASIGSSIGARSKGHLRQGFVLLQFAIAMIFTVATLIMVAQVEHSRQADVGYRRDGLLIVAAVDEASIDAGHRRALLSAFAALPSVSSATVADSAPTWLPATRVVDFSRADDPSRVIAASIIPSGPSYFETYGARRIAGRLFDAVHALDRSEPLAGNRSQPRSPNVVLNLAAVRAFGFTGPDAAIGKIVRGGSFGEIRIVGVVADMRFNSPHERVTPAIYTPGGDRTGQMFAIHFRTGDPAAITAEIERICRRIAPGVEFQTDTAGNNLEEAYYKTDFQRSRLFIIGAMLAILIGCLGLYGLAAFDTARRIREIGIRKALGASTADIMRLLVGHYLRPVLLANLLAWPIAYALMRWWLSGFEDRVALSPLYFIGASVVAIGIATLTVIGHAWRVACAEPARALRHV